MANSRVHRLALYEAAVQNPLAEVHFLEKAWEHYFGDDVPWLLREDFAGTSAIAAAFVASDPDRQAMTIDIHGPTTRWAQREMAKRLGERSEDLHVVCADVMEVTRPKTDAVVAMNFALMEWHHRDQLRAYLKLIRRSLNRPGLFIADLYGGPGAWQTGIQWKPAEGGMAGDGNRETLGPVEMGWEQKIAEPATGRVKNHLHFRGSKIGKRTSAFKYDWRLWSPMEVIETAIEVGFDKAQFWCDRLDEHGQPTGEFRANASVAGRHDWVGYVACVAG